MGNLEQKLRNYYENNSDYNCREAFAEELKALESRRQPAAIPPRRRRYAPAIAAAVTLTLLLGSGWAWVRSRQPAQDPVSGGTAQDGQTLCGPEGTAPVQSEAPAQAEPGSTAPAKSDGAPVLPGEAAPATIEEAAPAQPENRSPVPPQDTAPVPEGPAPAQTPSAPPDEPEPPVPDEPEPPAQDVPEPPAQDEPEPPVQDEPEPPVQDEPEPPVQDEPEPPAPPEFDAVYHLRGDRETVTMTLMSTGECVEVDVTGWEQQAPAAESPAYTGSNPVVNFIFEKDITYRLSREDDGTVRVDLDVDDAETERSGKGEEP